MFRKAVSKTIVLPLVVLIIIATIFFSLFSNFSEKVKETEEPSTTYTCKLAGTTNKCCLPTDDNVIPANVGKWKDCEEPEIACCIG